MLIIGYDQKVEKVRRKPAKGPEIKPTTGGVSHTNEAHKFVTPIILTIGIVNIV